LIDVVEPLAYESLNPAGRHREPRGV